MKEGIKIKCNRCEAERIYRGKYLNPKYNYPVYTTCSRCGTKIRIRRSK